LLNFIDSGMFGLDPWQFGALQHQRINRHHHGAAGQRLTAIKNGI